MIFPTYIEEVRYYPKVDVSAIPMVQEDLNSELGVMVVSVNAYESDILENPCVKAVILRKLTP